MKLRSLGILPASPSGWHSGELVFGTHITQLFGPNGCGKTPIIQSIPFALGYPVKFRDDVLRNCDAAVLSLDTDSGRVDITRKFGEHVDVTVSRQGVSDRHFYNEKDYSAYLFELLKVSTSTLTSTTNEPVEPYSATFLPLFYVDQDQGYSGIYKPPASFVRDQYAEMMRLVFALPAKHGYERHKLRIEKSRQLSQLDRQITSKGELINDLGQELGASRRPRQQVLDELTSNREKLEGLKSSRSVKSDAYQAIDELIFEKQSVIADAAREGRDLQARIDGFSRIEKEIEVEVATLSLNEEARRVFVSFKDICANPACGLFLGSSDSYGKNLLYLRDQVKDLQRNMGAQKRRIEQLTEIGGQLTQEIQELEQRQEECDRGSEVVGLIEAIGELTSRVIDLQRELRTVEELEDEEKAYVQLLNERDAVQNDIAALSTSAGQGDLRALNVRAQLRDGVRHWLDVLHTKNVSREVTVDPDFGFQFGGEKINQFHGSTLTRVILAMHTALFELYTKDEANQMRVLILDTPRQQDIETTALASFITALKSLASTQNAQVVFSTTEYHYQSSSGDMEWKPSFPGGEQQMFLGVSGSG